MAEIRVFRSQVIFSFNTISHQIYLPKAYNLLRTMKQKTKRSQMLDPCQTTVRPNLTQKLTQSQLKGTRYRIRIDSSRQLSFKTFLFIRKVKTLRLFLLSSKLVFCGKHDYLQFHSDKYARILIFSYLNSFLQPGYMWFAVLKRIFTF